jgi:hypothetical protein
MKIKTNLRAGLVIYSRCGGRCGGGGGQIP